VLSALCAGGPCHAKCVLPSVVWIWICWAILRLRYIHMHLPHQQSAMLPAAAAVPAAECHPMPTTTSCLPSQTQADLICQRLYHAICCYVFCISLHACKTHHALCLQPPHLSTNTWWSAAAAPAAAAAAACISPHASWVRATLALEKCAGQQPLQERRLQRLSSCGTQTRC
jgi:hypothetical protein